MSADGAHRGVSTERALNLPQDVAIDGTLGTRLLPDNTVVSLTPLLFDDLQVSIAAPHPRTGEPDLEGWGQAYMFDADHTAHTLVAFLAYDPEQPEPFGWYRHLPSNRRRPFGDPAMEHVEP
jgi:hypothetical protein